ncbi:MAG: hypothetical protein ACI4WX_01735 [Aristaeellaceae bacterium]
MADLFKLQGKVELDTSEFDSDVDEAVGKGKSMADSISGNGNSIRGALQNAFSFSAGQLISDGLKEAWNFIRDISAESIKLASDLNEVQNVVDVTFGSGSMEINSWAKAAQNAFGMSELKAKKFSSTMGAMLKSMGFAGDEVLDMSESLTQLAGDMASFYNLEHEEAFEKIRSGISGETEPLKQLGINMSVVNLEAFAMSRGITKSYDAMTQAEQTMLRYNYLLSTTSDAQGDFARTSDSYANQIKLLNENIKSIEAELGQTLIDFITPGLQQLNEWLQGDTFQNTLLGINQTENADIANANGKYGQASSIIDGMDELISKYGEAAITTDEWAAATKALTTVMPELGKYVDEATGQITSNTDQLRQNADAVHALAIYDARKRAIDSYAQAVSDAEADLADKQVSIWIKNSEVDSWQSLYNQKIQEIADSAGMAEDEVEKLFDTGSDFSSLIESGLVSGQLVDYVYNIIGSIASAKDGAKAAQDAYAESAKNLDTANNAYNTAELALEGYTNRTQEAALASREYMSALDAEIASMANVKNMADELRAAYDEMKKAARSQVESVVSGFKQMDNETKTPVENVMEALTSQTTYMTEYSKNMQKAMDMGLDTGLINKLADGSEESAAILRGLTEASGTEADNLVSELNAAWAANQEAMDAMAESLATSHANASEEFQGLVSDLQQAIEELSQQDEARAAMESTLDGIDQAMKNKKDGLISTAQSIVDGLSATFGGMSLGFSFGGFRIGGVSIGSNAKGMDYVPYNNYLTYLHKGEKVMSAMEADRYRAGQMGQAQGIDYDRLASAVAGVLTGAVVQMDGRAVGELVAPTVSRSIQQGAWSGRYGK